MREDEAARLREIRLACLAADPDAFTSTHASEAARPAEWWTRWATRSAEGVEQATFVVTDDDDRWHGLALVRADDEHPGEAVLNLCVMFGNDAALRLYETSGFTEHGRTPDILSMTRALR